MPLTVLFNTYPVAFHCPGGGEIQLLKYKEALSSLGVRVLLYDPWKPQFDQVDLVHYFSVQGGSWRFCMHVRQIGLPLVISSILWITPERLKSPIDEIYTLLHNCDAVLPNSIAEARQQSKIFGVPLEKFMPIVNGVEEIFLQPADPQLFRSFLGTEGPFVLNVGNIERRKNQLGLIRAMQGLGLPLILVGNVREPDYWNQCQAEGGRAVRWVGPLEYGGELHRSAYAACAVFALPSTMETPGLTALEALACGARVVITQEGCTHEYFEGHAIYVAPDLPESIREGLLLALSRPVNVCAQRQFVAERYTWARAAQQLLDVYTSVVNSEGRSIISL